VDVDLALYVEHQIFLDYLLTAHALEDHDLFGQVMACDGHYSDHAAADQPTDFKLAYLSVQDSLLVLALL